MDRIENLSDQLEGYSEEIESLIKKFEEKGFTRGESIEIVELGLTAQFVDVLHHTDEDFRDAIQVWSNFKEKELT